MRLLRQGLQRIPRIVLYVAMIELTVLFGILLTMGALK